MADEPGSVPEPVRAWLAEVAASSGVTEEELLGRLLSTDGEGLLPGDAGGPGVGERLSDLEAAVDDLDSDLDRKIADVRERVVQLKLEGEGKAPADHDHPGVASRLGQLAGRLDAVEGEIEAAADRLATVQERTDAGFSNFEEVLEYLVETTDDLREEVSTLAEATIDGRERLRRLAAVEARRAAADELRESAADHGVTAASCESCGASVSIGLLTAPECPHCGVGFTELEPRRGFFRSSVLHAGQRPALEGEVAGSSPELRSLARPREGDAPTVDRPGDERVVHADGEDGADEGGADAGRDQVAGNDRAEGSGSGAGGADDRELTSVPGIGPAYSERLRRAGVETVGELALADPERLAADADIDEGRVQRMVRRAREQVGSG